MQRRKIMEKHIKLLVIAVSTMVLLAGCCTPRPATQWEYKVAFVGGAGNANVSPNAKLHEAQEALLNNLAKDGWVFVAKGSDGGFIFKRPKR
jgi:hypothetical protein